MNAPFKETYKNLFFLGEFSVGNDLQSKQERVLFYLVLKIAEFSCSFAATFLRISQS